MQQLTTWHVLSRRLVDQLRQRSLGKLPSEPTVRQLEAAIRRLERDAKDERFPSPGRDVTIRRPEMIGPRDVLEWAKTDGPLSAVSGR